MAKVTYVNKAGEEVASLDVPVDRFVFFATEDADVDVPIVNKKRMCRNGCCTTCAVKVLEGKVRPLDNARWKGIGVGPLSKECCSGMLHFIGCGRSCSCCRFNWLDILQRMLI